MILAASMFINLKLHSLIEINFEDEIEKRENEINIKKSLHLTSCLTIIRGFLM